MLPMRLLVLEDDSREIARIESALRCRKDFELVSITNSVDEAIYTLKESGIEAVILDIELNKGIGGSGLDFLINLETLDLDFRPLVIVATNNESEAVYNACRNKNVDMIYYKSKEDYNPSIILTQFITLRPFIQKSKVKSEASRIETEIKRKERIVDMINEELDVIGIPPQMKGRLYIFDAIEYLINNSKKDTYYTNYLHEKYKVRKGGISTSIQDAINNAWRNTAEDDLLEHFTANISYTKGTPTPEQFIHYYVDKVKRRI